MFRCNFKCNIIPPKHYVKEHAYHQQNVLFKKINTQLNPTAFFQGSIMSIIVCLCIVVHISNCQSHWVNDVHREYSEVQQRPSAAAGKPYGTDNVQNHGSGGYHSLPDVNDNEKWRIPESSGVHQGGGYSNAALTDVTGVAVNGGGPVVVSGGSVVLRPSAGGFVVDGAGGIGTFGEPEAAGVQQLLRQPLSAVGPYDAAGDGVLQFVPPPPQHHHPFGHPFFRASGLLRRLLFGPPPLDVYSPLCSRLTAVGRFLFDRVFEPLFATGFFMAASYLFRTSVLPRIAHYIHVYTVMKDHVVDDGRFAGGRQISGYLDALTAAVNDAVNDDIPCFRRIVCEAGLQLASSPVVRSARR